MMTVEFPSDPEAICYALYHTETTFSRCIGYCTFHNAYVTRRQLKTKQCLQKNCNALVKNTNHQFWIEREQKKEELKLKRIEEKKAVEETFAKYNLITENQKKKNIHIRQKRFICIDLKTCKLTGKQKQAIKGLNNEVIQIGAVMLDEELNYLSQFSTFIKPLHGVISKESVDNPEFYKECLEHADTFSTAFIKLYTWAGSNKDDITTLCWSNFVYNQLWNEIFLKARNHDEYRDFLKTFIDLQAVFGKAIIADKQISFESTLKYCFIKFDGIRDSALSYAFNEARIFNKLMNQNKENIDFIPLWKYTETELSKYFYTTESHSKDFTSSFAAFMSEDLIKQFIEETKPVVTKTNVSRSKKTPLLFSKLFTCSKYGINVNNWVRFSSRMLFIRDVNYYKLYGTKK